MASSISAGTTSSTGLVATADTTGALVLQTNNGTTAITLDTSQNATFVGYANLPNTFGFKNRIINGLMQIAQRATSGTSGSAVPTTAPTYPSVDRWYAYATGATVTVARVAGSNANQYNLQATGAASVTAIGIGQRIEQSNSYDMAGSTATLSVNISNSLLTTVTWTANYATSADTWSAKTQIATGTFTVTSTLTNYNAQISIPSAATTGIEILFTVGAQTSGTWVIGNVQLEKSSIATSFDYISYSAMLALCYRYYYKIGAGISNGFNTFGLGYVESSTSAKFIIPFPVSMRIPPTALEQSGTAANYAVRYTNVGFQNCSAVPTHDSGTYWTATFDFTVASGLTGGQAIMGRTGNSTGTNAYLAWSAEL